MNMLSWVHALKILIALAVGYVLVTIIHEPHSRWVIITIVMVMSYHLSFGFQFERSIARVIGTLVGAVLGALAIQLPHIWLLNFLVFLLVSAGFLVAGTMKPAWKYMVVLGIATFTMVSVTATPLLSIAVERPLEIIAGIVVVLLVSRFIHPIKSEKLLDYLYQSNWDLLKQWATFIIDEHRHRHQDDEVNNLENKLRKNFQEQVDLLKSIDIRRSLKLPGLRQRIVMQRGIFRYLVLIEVVQRQYDESDTPVVFDWGDISRSLMQSFTALSDGQEAKGSISAFGKAIGSLKVRAQHVTDLESDGVATLRYSLTRIHYILSEKI